MIQTESDTDIIPITLDFRAKTPLSEQIRQALHDQILSGELQPGSPLPTVRHLALQLGVNFNTVARAYRSLDLEGLIRTRQGRGTYIEESYSLAFEQTEENLQETAHQLVDALLRNAARKGVPSQELLDALKRRVEEQNNESAKGSVKAAIGPRHRRRKDTRRMLSQRLPTDARLRKRTIKARPKIVSRET